MAEGLRQPPAGPLPSGRHRLSREQVAASQRRRMLTAMAEAMKDYGYAGTAVADVVRRAGVSRETFYQQFSSKQDCFIQALDDAMEVLSGLLELPAVAPSPDPDGRFRELLRGYLHTLAEQPAFARVFLVEVYAAGPEAMARRRQLQRRFADAIAVIFGIGSGDGDRRFGCDALVAATAQLVTVQLAAGDLEGLRDLEDPLVRLAHRLLTTT